MLWVGSPVTFSLNFIILCSFFFSGVKSDLPREHDQESLVNVVSSDEVRRIFLLILVVKSSDHPTVAGESSDGAGQEE